MMTRTTGIITSVLSALALVLSIISLVTGTKNAQPDPASIAVTPPDVQYVMYLGTNDKDTNEPVYPPEEAKTKAEEILLDHFGGYTIQEASGGWVDDGKVYREYTLVIYLSDTSLEDVHAAAGEMVREFNQSSVLIQANQTTTEFYSGEGADSDS